MRFVQLFILTLLPAVAFCVFAGTNVAIAHRGIAALLAAREEGKVATQDSADLPGTETFVFSTPEPTGDTTNPTPPPNTDEPAMVPTPTIDPSHIVCTGPDGKQFRTTQEACDSLNQDWAEAVARDKAAAEKKMEEKKLDKDNSSRHRWGWGWKQR